jgi:predicted acyltransferase
MDKKSSIEEKQSSRLLSLDAFRGFTMLLLIGEFTELFGYLVNPIFDGSIIGNIGIQFHHIEWNGLHFWDLIQPFFMFIVGVAIPFSERNRRIKGSSDKEILKHALIRSFLLLLFGWALYCIGPGRITFRFQNVLAQLSVTYLLAFLIRNKSISIQLLISFFLLALTEFSYRTFSVSGFDQPFTPDKNFGAYFDLLISGELSGGHWVSFNAIPTAAHTIWGVIVGKILLSEKTKQKTLITIIVAGVIGIFIGYTMDQFTPIVKRISTTSFVFVSGGWSILSLALFYWIIDILKYSNWAKFIIIVGSNSLFIYLFAHVGGAELVYNIVKPFSFGLVSGLGELYAGIVTSIITWFLLWYITYWLYTRKIFIKI